jgi:hypothetical protein
LILRRQRQPRRLLPAKSQIANQKSRIKNP